MKKISILAFILVLCLPGYAQWNIGFDWDDPDCSYCLWMENTIGMSGRQAYDYQYIVHQYGKRIERETNRNYRYWDQVAKNIYKLRMARDSRLQDILSPAQFRLYITLSREQPIRIHDGNGWFNARRYVYSYPSSICYQYEDHYWHSSWEFVRNHWYPRFDDNDWYIGKYKYPEYRPNSRYDKEPRYDNNIRWNPEKRRDDHSSNQYMNPNSGRDQHRDNSRANDNFDNSTDNKGFTGRSQLNNNDRSDDSRSNRKIDSFRSRAGSESQPDNTGRSNQRVNNRDEQRDNSSMNRKSSNGSHSDRSGFDVTRNNRRSQKDNNTIIKGE